MHEARYRSAERALFASAGIEPIERWVPLATVGTTARVIEVGEGPPVLFLSGGPDAGATWAYVAAAMPDMRCLLVDRPGTGLSDPPRTIPGVDQLPDYVACLTRDLLDGLELQRASLVGCSFGGMAALRSALALGSRVDRVLLAGFPAFVPGWQQPRFFTLLRTPVIGGLLLRAPVTAASVRFSLRELGHRRALERGAIALPMLDWIRAWQRDTDTMPNDAEMIRACGSTLTGFDPHLDLRSEELGAIRQPCLVLVGTDDPVGGADAARDLGAMLGNATVEIWPDAGHLPWLDDPLGFGQAASAFLAARAPADEAR